MEWVDLPAGHFQMGAPLGQGFVEDYEARRLAMRPLPVGREAPWSLRPSCQKTYKPRPRGCRARLGGG